MPEKKSAKWVAPLWRGGEVQSESIIEPIDHETEQQRKQSTRYIFSDSNINNNKFFYVFSAQ